MYERESGLINMRSITWHYLTLWWASGRMSIPNWLFSTSLLLLKSHTHKISNFISMTKKLSSKSLLQMSYTFMFPICKVKVKQKYWVVRTRNHLLDGLSESRVRIVCQLCGFFYTLTLNLHARKRIFSFVLSILALCKSWQNYEEVKLVTSLRSNFS